MKKKSEYKEFARTVDALFSVSHAEIKAKLDAEKEAKKQKKSRKSSASGRVANGRV